MNQRLLWLLLLIPIVGFLVFFVLMYCQKSKGEIYRCPIGIMPSPDPSLTRLWTKSSKPQMGFIENFFTKEECKDLIQIFKDDEKRQKESRVRSKNGGSTVKKDHRNSTTLYADKKSPRFQAIIQKISNLFGLPPSHFESPQFTYYTKGGFFKPHLDHSLKNPKSFRVMSVFIYLNDNFEGGETHFTQLNYTVKPKQGMAVWWLNVDPSSRTLLTSTKHEGKVVQRGEKYGMNIWIRNIPYAPKSTKSS